MANTLEATGGVRVIEVQQADLLNSTGEDDVRVVGGSHENGKTGQGGRSASGKLLQEKLTPQEEMLRRLQIVNEFNLRRKGRRQVLLKRAEESEGDECAKKLNNQRLNNLGAKVKTVMVKQQESELEGTKKILQKEIQRSEKTTRKLRASAISTPRCSEQAG